MDEIQWLQNVRTFTRIESLAISFDDYWTLLDMQETFLSRHGYLQAVRVPGYKDTKFGFGEPQIQFGFPSFFVR